MTYLSFSFEVYAPTQGSLDLVYASSIIFTDAIRLIRLAGSPICNIGQKFPKYTMLNGKLKQFYHCHENGHAKMIPIIPHDLFRSFFGIHNRQENCAFVQHSLFTELITLASKIRLVYIDFFCIDGTHTIFKSRQDAVTQTFLRQICISPMSYFLSYELFEPRPLRLRQQKTNYHF